MYFLGNRDENWARDKSAGGDWDVKTYRAWEESGVESRDDGVVDSAPWRRRDVTPRVRHHGAVT